MPRTACKLLFLLPLSLAAYAEVVEVSLTASRQLRDPYVEGLPDNGARAARVIFVGQGRKITVAAFWDGGRTWKARFAPAAAGQWSYTVQSEDPGMSGARGTVRAASACRFLRVARNGHYFEYTDGTPWLWIGDTWWNWAKRGIHFETFQKLADDRAAKGFTVGQLFFSGANKFDLEQIRKVERMIAYANSRGITVWIHPWWSGKHLAAFGPERVRRWWRYVLDRFGAYEVLWVLAGEYNMDNYGGLGLQFWKDLGAMIRREDPYRRLISAHPTPPGWKGGAAAPQWSTGEVLHKERWLDYNQSQLGHARWRNEMAAVVIAADYARKPPKPATITEPWYEFIEGNAPAADVRFAAWSAMLSGAAGFTYGGGHVWWAHVPEAPMGKTSWPLHREFDTDTLDYPGALGVSFMAKFLKGIEWWRMAPHPELVHDYAARYCLAVPGREYVVLLRWGGVARLDLRPSGEHDTFEYRWLKLADRTMGKVLETQGGAIREFRAQGDNDVILHVKRR